MKTLKELQYQFNESIVPDDQKGKQKPYVSSDGKGNFEVLGNKGQTKQTFTRKEHGALARDKAQAHLKSKYNEYMKEEVDEICEDAGAGLAAKSSKSGISVGTLRKVYNRGMAAWKTGHRPGTTPQQWGMARVNSYIGKGKGTYGGADKDLREQDELDESAVPKDKETGLPKKYVAGVSDSTAKARAAHFDKNKEKSDSDPSAYKPAPGDATAKTKPSKHTLKYRAMFGEDMDEEIYEACWDSHKQVGLKKKGDKMVPNCVPKNEQVKPENDLPFDPDPVRKPVKNSDGTTQSPMSRARELAKQALNRQRVKEEIEIDEGMKQNLRKYVPGYAKRELDKKMDAQAYEKGDSTKKTVDKDVNYDRYKKIADKMKKEEVEFSMTAEEFEQLDEISKKTLGSYVNKASVDMANRTAEGERKRTLAGADYAHNISRGMSAKTADADMKKDYAAAKPDVKKSVKRMYGISKAVGRLTKEENEPITEANHREFASQGMMHPDMAKNMVKGREMDFYASGTGDKKSGIVTHRDDKEVHLKTTHDPYSKEKGKVHKFRIAMVLNKSTNEEKDMEEELKGNQHKLDANKNGKIDKFDFTKLRARRKKMEEAACMTDKKDVKEKINLNMVKMSDVVKDFQKSDAPQFDGKSDKKRQQMAVAAKLEADRKAMKEEFQGFNSYLKIHEDISEEIIEEGMISYTDFNNMMTAQRKAGNRVLDYKHGEKSAHYVVVDKEGTKRKVTYTETGKKMENMGGSTNKEKPAEPAEKRGRGRPKGSASGARLKGSAKDNDDDSGLDDTRYSVNLPSGRR